MQIARDRVVALEYTLKDVEGKVIDTNQDGEDFYYLHGHHGIVPGLERALEGKERGAALDVELEPEDGYGEYDEALVFDVPRSALPEGLEIRRGEKVRASAPDGSTRAAVITKVKLQTVTLDANHELAGKKLFFSVRVKDVRKATRDEIAHGHAHGPGGHHHH